MAFVKTHVMARRNARGGHSAVEHLVAALRCLYQRAVDDGLLQEAEVTGAAGRACQPGPLGRDHGQPRHRDRTSSPAALGVAEADIARVHRPIGLNIGSRTPPEIAIATLAGLIADRNGRPGGFTF